MRRAKNPARSLGGIMQSTEFAEEIGDFDVSDVVGVESTILRPSIISPLK
jgi:hypothetical protein